MHYASFVTHLRYGLQATMNFRRLLSDERGRPLHFRSTMISLIIPKASVVLASSKNKTVSILSCPFLTAIASAWRTFLSMSLKVVPPWILRIKDNRNLNQNGILALFNILNKRGPCNKIVTFNAMTQVSLLVWRTRQWLFDRTNSPCKFTYKRAQGITPYHTRADIYNSYDTTAKYGNSATI